VSCLCTRVYIAGHTIAVGLLPPLSSNRACRSNVCGKRRLTATLAVDWVLPGHFVLPRPDEVKFALLRSLLLQRNALGLTPNDRTCSLVDIIRDPFGADVDDFNPDAVLMSTERELFACLANTDS